MLVNICMKFHEDTLNGFQVTVQTRFCDGQTDGWTVYPGKNNKSPNPKCLSSLGDNDFFSLL